jgi:preprotein translocase subunit SecD
MEEKLAIVLDEDILQIANIKSRVSTRGIMSGRFTREEVRGIVAVLRAGPLPVLPEQLRETEIPVEEK